MFQISGPLPIRASELEHCIYCESSLPASSKEHIFNASWGGSHETASLICSKCNNLFSDPVDTAFSDITLSIMNSWQFKGVRHKNIPEISTESNYFFAAGAQLQLKQPIIEKATREDGSIQETLVSASKASARRWLKSEEAIEHFGHELSDEEKNVILQRINKAEISAVESVPQLIHRKVDLRSQYRSASHTILKCLGFFLPEWVMNESTLKIRKFVEKGEGDWKEFAALVTEHTSIQSHARSQLGHGPSFNSVEVYWSSSLKKIIGKLNLLNRVSRYIILARGYSGPDQILYVVEPVNSSKRPPKALLTTFPSEANLPPIWEPCPFESARQISEFVSSEYQYLMQIEFPVGGVTSNLMKRLEKFFNSDLIIDEQSFNQLVSHLSAGILAFSSLMTRDISEKEIESSLHKYGLQKLLATQKGEQYKKEENQAIIAEAFQRTIGKIMG